MTSSISSGQKFLLNFLFLFYVSFTTFSLYFQVTVALVDLSPDFHYNSVPRLSAYSFLQAKTKNTSPYTMLAGPANIFMDNNFIAKVRGHRHNVAAFSDVFNKRYVVMQVSHCYHVNSYT